uniref:Uncharacterized protein n=1 Tax=Cacopsylla melanoneura TaxID=428564 RepID=A0A8D8QU55_9HEMI
MPLLDYARLVISVLVTSNMVLSTERPDKEHLVSKFDDFLEQFDIDLGKDNHPFKEKLHPDYCANLKNKETGELLLLHDHRGNIHNSTFHYLALKTHEIYDIPNSFISEKAVRKSNTGGLSEEAIMYLAHRNLMRHTLGHFSLEFYMTLLYRSRQESLERISNHYTGTRRRDIIEKQIAKDNFDEQFSALLGRLKVLMTEQMLYTEKCYYWNRDCNIEDDASSVSKEIRLLGVIHEQQRILCENLPEFYKLIKTKRKFFIQNEMKDQIVDDNAKKKVMKFMAKEGGTNSDFSFYDSQAENDDKK